MVEQSYVMVKPEFANNTWVICEVKDRLLDAGMKIVGEGYVQYDPERAKLHYHEHVGKDFYPELQNYITSDKAYGMIVEGKDAIVKVRSIVGATKNPVEGTIRYDIPQMLGIKRRITQNVVHASDSEESAKNEIKIFKELKREYLNSLDR